LFDKGYQYRSGLDLSSKNFYFRIQNQTTDEYPCSVINFDTQFKLIKIILSVTSHLMMDTLLIDAPTKDIVDTAVEAGSYKTLDTGILFWIT
jgi:hypothetical protein